MAVEPYTGRVIAYYGGPKGEGVDYAGSPADPVLDDGKMKMFGFHPAASSFKIYTLGAGLTEDVSINSYWNGKSPALPGRGTPVKNSTPRGAARLPAVGQTVSPEHPVLRADAGVEEPGASVLDSRGAEPVHADDNGVVHDLNRPRHRTGHHRQQHEHGVQHRNRFGQYGGTVWTTPTARVARGGRQASKVHFIAGGKDDQRVYNESTNHADPRFTPRWPPTRHGRCRSRRQLRLNAGSQVAAKTGTWENAKTRAQRALGTVGYTAAARGDKNGEELERVGGAVLGRQQGESCRSSSEREQLQAPGAAGSSEPS